MWIYVCVSIREITPRVLSGSENPMRTKVPQLDMLRFAFDCHDNVSVKVLLIGIIITQAEIRNHMQIEGLFINYLGTVADFATNE